MKRTVILPVEILSAERASPGPSFALVGRLRAMLAEYGPHAARVVGLLVPTEQHGFFLVRRPMLGKKEALLSVPEWTPVGQLTPASLQGLPGFDLGWLIMGMFWEMEFCDTTRGQVKPVLNLAVEEVTNQEWNDRFLARLREAESHEPLHR